MSAAHDKEILFLDNSKQVLDEISAFQFRNKNIDIKARIEKLAEFKNRLTSIIEMGRQNRCDRKCIQALQKMLDHCTEIGLVLHLEKGGVLAILIKTANFLGRCFAKPKN